MRRGDLASRIAERHRRLVSSITGGDKSSIRAEREAYRNNAEHYEDKFKHDKDLALRAVKLCAEVLIGRM